MMQFFVKALNCTFNFCSSQVCFLLGQSAVNLLDLLKFLQMYQIFCFVPYYDLKNVF